MKRQLVQFFIFIGLVITATYDVAKTKLAMPPVSMMSEADTDIARQDAPTIPFATVTPVTKSVEPGKLPNKPAGSPAAARPPMPPTQTTATMSPMEQSAQPHTLPEKPAGSPAAARPPELAAPEIETPPTSARPSTFPKKPHDQLLEAQQTAPQLSPGDPPINLRPKVMPPVEVAEPTEPINIVPTSVEQTEIIEEQQTLVELPPSVEPIQQEPQPPAIVMPSIQKESKVPFELQEMEEPEEVAPAKKDEHATSFVPMPENVAEPE